MKKIIAEDAYGWPVEEAAKKTWQRPRKASVEELVSEVHHLSQTLQEIAGDLRDLGVESPASLQAAHAALEQAHDELEEMLPKEAEEV